MTLPAAQLSPHQYFSDAVYQAEQAVFHKTPRYIGHSLSVPHKGDYFTLAHEGNGRVLTHTEQGVELLSNVCRHRQAVILGGLDTSKHQRGSLNKAGGNIVCPLHRWTYNSRGELVGAPHFSEDPCLHLQRFATHNWNGLLFESGANSARHVATDLADLGCAADLDFSGYQFHRAHIHECPYNWKSFIEVYLEDYHVEPFHPGLGKFVACDDLSWEFGEHYSVQTVGVKARLGTAGSSVYEQWHNAVTKYHSGTLPKYGAIWLTLYPNVMVEWYPQVLVVSTLYPRSPQHTTNVVEFFYPEEICAFEQDFIAAQQAAYMETCVEDDEIALRMDAGRKALMLRGTHESGPYQSPMEDGMAHFHQWYAREMRGELPCSGFPPSRE